MAPDVYIFQIKKQTTLFICDLKVVCVFIVICDLKVDANFPFLKEDSESFNIIQIMLVFEIGLFSVN
jgi:hypothetical protein